MGILLCGLNGVGKSTNGDLSEKESAWFALVSSRPENFVTEWLEEIKCPIIRIDGTLPVEENVEYLLSVLKIE